MVEHLRAELKREFAREIDEKVNERLQQLILTAPAPAPSAPQQTTSISPIIIGGTNNTGIGIGISVSNGISIWNPTQIDFEPLKTISDRLLPPSSILDRSLIKKHPTEALLQEHLQLEAPKNASVFAASENWDGIRFFDGVAYRRVEDPKKEMDERYQLYAKEQRLHLETNTERIRELCDWQDIDFDVRSKAVKDAPSKVDRFDVILDKVVAASKKVRPAIEEKQIPVDP